MPGRFAARASSVLLWSSEFGLGPIDIPLLHSLAVSLVLRCCSTGPCISPAGQFYVPEDGNQVVLYDSNGSKLHSITASSVGLSQVHDCAFIPGSSLCLLLAGGGIVVIDRSCNSICWSNKTTIYGISPLTQHGVLVATLPMNGDLLAMSLVDGTVLGRASARHGTLLSYVVADSESGLIFVSSQTASRHGVQVWSWGIAGGTLEALRGVRTPRLRFVGVIAAAGHRETDRPLAVMPRAPGKTVSYLIVGACFEPGSCVCCRFPS